MNRRQRRADGKTYVVIDTSSPNHPPENAAIQLPLIETHHSRVICQMFCFHRLEDYLFVLARVEKFDIEKTIGTIRCSTIEASTQPSRE